jgi:serine/threonine protein kinase
MDTQGVGGTYPTGPSGTFVGPDENPDLYELIRHIGLGGEAQVWRAKTRPDPSSPAGITVAVKVFTVQNSPVAQTEWLRRTQAMAHVRNPGLAQTLSVFVGASMHSAGERPDPSRPRSRYMVMEFVDGQSLQEWVEDHPEAGLRERFNLLSPIAAALDSLHTGTDTIPPIAHGDVKPDNARITADGGVKLVDFGLMRMQGTSRGGPAMASIPYTAPEIFAAGPDAMPTIETDRFSFAATVFHVLTGQSPPLRADGRGPDPSAMRPILESSPLTAARPEVSNSVIAALAADPRDRPTSLTRWLGGARATSSIPLTTRPASTIIASGQPFAPPAPSPGGPERPARRGNRRLIVGAVIAVLVMALGGGAYAMTLRSGSGQPQASPTITPTAAQLSLTPSPTDTPTPTQIPSTTDTATTDSSPATTTSSLSVDSTQTDGAVITNALGAPLLLAGDDNRNGWAIASSGGVRNRSQVAINTKVFDTAFVYDFGDNGPTTIDLNLERGFSMFTGRLGTVDSSPLGQSSTIKVVGDGKLLLTRTVALGVSFDVRVPVKNVLRLQITFGAHPGRFIPAIGDPTVLP